MHRESSCEILKRSKSLKRFQFVSDYGKACSKSRFICFDILDFKEAGLNVLTYRKIIRCKIEGKRLTGYTLDGALHFSELT